MGALLQPRANFEFLAKYFQGAFFLSLNQSMYCYIFDWYLDFYNFFLFQKETVETTDWALWGVLGLLDQKVWRHSSYDYECEK